MSCGRSSRTWFASESSFPWMSVRYPSSRSRSTGTPTSEGRKWVRGRSIMSYRIVPSLKTKRPWCARRIPFSTGSTAFSREIIPRTPFTSTGAVSRMPRRSMAACNSSFRFTVTRWEEVAGVPQRGQ